MMIYIAVHMYVACVPVHFTVKWTGTQANMYDDIHHRFKHIFSFSCRFKICIFICARAVHNNYCHNCTRSASYPGALGKKYMIALNYYIEISGYIIA